ncbi:hypothetical protein D9756_010734 [Leucocoprinus leucothites]|uniref:Uncharacterized protein n=1 Tax=Leucocoprinus leucothites TaxID=201217 RepID=A0A8H5CW58_9AGAR|nr:hypothetical protein D9756_010734 [Leucoagaricus leucothites]
MPHPSDHVPEIFERGWAFLAKLILDLQKMVERNEVIRKAERKQFAWRRYFELILPEIRELIDIQNVSKSAHQLLRSFLKLHLQAQVQLTTRSLLCINFHNAQPPMGPKHSWFCLDAHHLRHPAEVLLVHDSFVFLQHCVEDERNVIITAPLFNPVAPSSSYAQRPGYTSNSPHESPSPYSHSRPPISLALALHSKEFEAIYTSIIPSVSLGKVRTQDSQTLRTRNENSFTGAPTRSGMEPPVWGRIVEAGGVSVKEWRKKFGSALGGGAAAYAWC